jgi:hypothetical protein
MPTHRIPRAHLDDDLKELRASGERVVTMTFDSTDDRVVVVTEFIGTETREAS